jgi:hypothetical protein
VSLRGFATISFWADDLPAAVAWYTTFGNVLGVMTNPHYLEILAANRPA